MKDPQTFTKATTLVTTTTPPTTPPTPVVCPIPVNGSYWIQLDPINNVSVGNHVFVNGTTNIPYGMDLNVDIIEQRWRPTPHYVAPHISGIAEIVKTDSCTNKFSYYSNITGLKGPNEFEVYVWAKDTHFSKSNSPSDVYKELKNDSPFNVSTFYITGEVSR